MVEIYEYDGFLSFSEIAPDIKKQIGELFRPDGSFPHPQADLS